MNTPTKLLSTLLVPICVSLLSGCANMKQAAGPNQDVVIKSTPAGASVSINDADSGVTPLVATMDRSQKYTVMIMQPGYKIVTVNVSKGFLSSSLKPNPVNVTLVPDPNPAQSLAKAVAALDAQLKSGKITAAQHQTEAAALVKFYSQPAAK